MTTPHHHRGRTIIAESVVATIAGVATRDVDGVHASDSGVRRVAGALRDRVPGARADITRGVSVAVDDSTAEVSLDLVAEYGTPVADLAADVRRGVTSAIRALTGLDCTRVDITIHDITVRDTTVRDTTPRDSSSRSDTPREDIR